MRVNEKLQQLGINPDTADFSDILAAIGEPDSFELQKDQVGTDLVSLVAFTDTSRTLLAEILGYKKSRVTRILSGMENLTLRTIHDVCKAVGYEFDVTFRKKLEAKPLQPWQTVEISFDKPMYGKLFIVKPVSTPRAATKARIYGANDDNWNSLKVATGT
jgi:antitoxin component HigA of HigAB toxin-antitoxin module